MPRIWVCLTPPPQVFRPSTLRGLRRPPGIFSLRLQDSPDSVPSLHTLSLEPGVFCSTLKRIHGSSETQPPMLGTQLPMLGRSFQNERTVREKEKGFMSRSSSSPPV